MEEELGRQFGGMEAKLAKLNQAGANILVRPSNSIQPDKSTGLLERVASLEKNLEDIVKWMSQQMDQTNHRLRQIESLLGL